MALAGGMDSSTGDRATGDGDRLASKGLAPVLGLEVAQSAGPATPEPRSPGTDCSNVAGEPAMRHRAHPRRAAQARDRGQQSIDSPPSMAWSQAGEKSELANVPAQSDQGHLGGGPIRGTDDQLPDFVRLLVDQPRAQGADSLQRYRQPDGGMDLETSDRSDRLGPPTAIPDP